MTLGFQLHSYLWDSGQLTFPPVLGIEARASDMHFTLWMWTFEPGPSERLINSHSQIGKSCKIWLLPTECTKLPHDLLSRLWDSWCLSKTLSCFGNNPSFHQLGVRQAPTPTPLVVTIQVSQLQITALIWNQEVAYVTSSQGSQHPPRDDFLT